MVGMVEVTLPQVPPRSPTRRRSHVSTSVPVLLLRRLVYDDGAGEHQDVVLAGGDVYAVGVAEAEPALADLGDGPAGAGEAVLVVEEVPLDLQVDRVGVAVSSTVNLYLNSVNSFCLTIATTRPPASSS